MKTHQQIRNFFAAVLLIFGNTLNASVVKTNSDDGNVDTLRQAILTSASGDTITFASNLSGATILLTNGPIKLTKDLTIDASELAKGIILSGNHANRVFEVTSNTVAVFNSVTIANGSCTNGPGGGINTFGTLILNNCVLAGNSSPLINIYATNFSGFGGGVCNSGDGPLSLTGCTLTTNSAFLGGGIANLGNGALSLTNCTLSQNAGNFALIAMENGHGGGICNYSNGPLVLVNCNLNQNMAAGGGGIANVGNGSLTMTNCTLSGNYSAMAPYSGPEMGRGAGIYNAGFYNPSGATAVLMNCTLSLNTANSYITAGGYGGGIYNGGTLKLSNCSLSENAALIANQSGFGGAVCNDGTLTIDQCTLSGNSACSGGGIFNFGTLTVNESTLFENSATNYNGQGGIGGAICNEGVSMRLYQSTLTKNSADQGGGIGSSANALIFNSIVAENSGGNIDGTLIYSGVNLTNGDAMLATPGNYGGFTQTMPPLSGSPAVDAGDDSATNLFVVDQRGVPRLSGLHTDIGATELQVIMATNPLVIGPIMLNDETFKFDFTNAKGASFTVFASTNAALPFTQWSNCGPAIEFPIGSGKFQFTYQKTTNDDQCFFRIRSP